MLFQNDIQNLEFEIVSLEALIAANRRKAEQLSRLESLADNTLEQIATTAQEIGSVSVAAIANPIKHEIPRFTAIHTQKTIYQCKKLKIFSTL